MTTATLNEAVTEASEPTKTKPVAKFFDKGVSFAVFPKTIKKDNGDEFTVFNTVIEARYKTKAGGYQSTSWFSEAQLTAVEDFARQARDHRRGRTTTRQSACRHPTAPVGELARCLQ